MTQASGRLRWRSGLAGASRPDSFGGGTIFVRLSKEPSFAPRVIRALGAKQLVEWATSGLSGRRQVLLILSLSACLPPPSHYHRLVSAGALLACGSIWKEFTREIEKRKREIARQGSKLEINSSRLGFVHC